MGIITAKQLKQKTGEMIRRVKRGETLTVTYRGTPVAELLPFDKAGRRPKRSLRPPEQAWQEIERTLDETEPEFEEWQEAMAWVRRRISS